MADSLQDRIALVTGAGSGIGRATSLAFAREGAKVAVVDITDGGEQTVRMIEDTGGEAIFIRADMSQRQQVESMVQQVIDTYGRIDCAHNNAGIAGDDRSLTHEYSEEEWDKLMDLNLKGVWLSMKNEIPHMLRQGKGAIVNTASVAGLVGMRINAAYIASKHGVNGLTKIAALEYADKGIRINSVCPGYIQTPAIERTMSRFSEFEEKAIASEPIGRMGRPSEIGEAVVWLCSDAASFVTGNNMVVDGGFTAQ
jgi:NAD(P)-dependent dehydrogenase (short-subunit alcohol dehydrogenase family)